MGYTLLSEAFPVARKQHRCIWCGEHIEPGEKYRAERSVFDGSMQNHHWHLECDEASTDHFLTNGPEFEPHENERPEKELTP